jgi:hypothetical protein
MRKIKLLLVAVFALVGMSAFAQVPAYDDLGYLYDAAGKKFINAEGKVGATGMEFKVVNPKKSQYTTGDGRSFDQYRFKTVDGSNGLGCNDKAVITTSTGTYGYGVFAVVPEGEGFRIMSTYTYADRAYNLKKDNCLGYTEDGTLTFVSEAEAPVWKFVDEETYKAIVADNAMPKKNDVGYLYNPATKQFITSSANMGDNGVEFIIADFVSCGESFGSDDGKINEAGYTYVRFKLNETSNYMRMSNSGVICTGSGYHKWAAIGTENGLVIRCIYTSTQGGGALSPFAQQGYYLTPDADGKLALVETPTEASYWQYMDKATYDAATGGAEIKATQDALAAMNDGAGVKAGDEILSVLFPNAGFDASNNADGWKVTTNGGNNPSYKVENGNCGMTKYQGTIKMDKTIKGLPAGWYVLKAQAFARKGNNASNIAAFEAGETLDAPGIIYANGVTKQVKNILEGAVTTKGNGNYTEFVVDGETKYILDNSNAGSYVFSVGEYEMELIVYVNEGEDFNFGFEKTSANDADYCGCDNFRLIYNGETMPQTFADGRYYFYNVKAQKYWGVGNDWGTQASLVPNSEFQTLAYTETGYTMESNVNNGGTQYYFNGDFMDNGTPKQLVITPAGKYYNITADGASYGFDGTSTILGKNVTGDGALWEIVSEAELNEQARKATPEAPVDVTAWISDPNFGRNNRYLGAWTMISSNQNLGGGDNENLCAESWCATFTLSQTMAVPNGKYILTAQAALTDYTGAYDGNDYPVVYANDVTAPFNNMDEGDRGTDMSTLSKAFAAGKYVVALDTIYVGDGKLTIGVKGTRTDTWCIWDNFTLFSCGELDFETIKEFFVKAVDEAKEINKQDPEMHPSAKAALQATIAQYDGAEYETIKEYLDATDAVKAAIAAANASAGIYADYRNALAAAREIFPETMPAGILVTLDKAIKDYQESKVLTADATEESISEAATVLWNAYNAAKTAVDNGKALMGMYELMENNNLVTPEAYDIYMGKFEEYSKQWKAGTLTETVVNPYAQNGWHNSSLDYDEYLLSTWTIGGTQCVNYSTPLYINTWSVEGESDGTNFKVPFFEYWTEDPYSLGQNELEATLADVEPGVYAVTAWVRVRAKNGTAAADATGITLQLNDGEAVDVTEGEAVDQFNLAEYTAEGNVEDGTLKIKFSVAADNNISWISFQNVKYEKTGDITTAISEVSSKTAAKSVFNVAGQQLAAPAKGLNIIDGKKVYIK